MKSYPLGTTVLLVALFKNLTTTPPSLVTPSSVVLTTLDPAGNVGTVTTSNPSTGKYEGSVTPAIPGIWHYKFVGSGSDVAAVSEGAFEVKPSVFEND